MNNRTVRLLGSENLVATLAGMIVFGVYLSTSCPTVSFTDSGELATVATTLGIAHPTGYPLWTLIGRLAVMLPLSSEPIVRLNLLACALTAAAMGSFFKLVLVLQRSQKVFGLRNRKQSVPSAPVTIVSTLITALIVGLSSTVWAQSVEIEVYALHVLLIVLTTVYFVSGLEEQLSDPRTTSRRLFIFGFVLGLSFANHMTTVLLAPGFLYLFFIALGLNNRSWKIILLLSPFFVLGLSVYCYMPIRSGVGPLMDWGHPVTVERIWWHVTGKQYQTWMFSGWDVAQKQLKYFLANFSTEFHWSVYAVLFVGLVETFYHSKRLLTFLLLLFAACLAYSMNFDIQEIDPYFLLAYVSCGCFIGIGLVMLMHWCWGQRSTVVASMVAFCLCALPVVQYFNNRSDVDQSENYQVEDFVHAVFGQLEPNAVVFSSVWDYFVSPSYYYQIVKEMRPDVTLIDRDLLQNRSWYFIQMERSHPEVLSRSKAKVDAFLVELNKFEKGEQFSYQTIKNRWDELLGDLVNKLMQSHPVYVDPRIAGEFPQESEGVPQGFLVRLVRKSVKGEWQPITLEYKESSFKNYVTADLKRYVATMYTYHALWMINHQRTAEARQILENGLRVDPTFLPARNLKAQLSRVGS